jgi:2-(1,2-epoxy-1,2-dihydrophenyl)acetyl-CoA isomerase
VNSRTDGPDRTSAEVLVDVAGHVATVTLNRPARLNALTPSSLNALADALEAVAADPAVRALVLTGAGRAFCAGGDVEQLGEYAMTAEFVREAVRVVEVLYSLRPVTIAAINGPCAGGGMALACATDLRCASESAFMVTSFLAIGTTGDMGLPWFLTRLVGASKAKELSLLGDRLTASQALELGIVCRTVPDETLSATATAIAERIAAMAPLASAGLKANLNDASIPDLAGFLDIESGRYAVNARTADANEAVRAFKDRRTAHYVGR